MRVGDNPVKLKKLNHKQYQHRIIVPVYIPNENGYYEHSFKVLRLSLTSLYQTVHKQTAITVIANECCAPIVDYLIEENRKGRIETLVVHLQNKGKVDSLVSIMKGCLEPLITITDCDVLFKAGWQRAVEEIYTTIPKVGMVSPIPLPEGYNSFTAWSWFLGITSGKIIQDTNQDEESIRLFKLSIGTGSTLTPTEQRPLYLNYKNQIACLGSGHFCATYNRNVVSFIPAESSGVNIVNAEKDFLDAPVEKGGFLRLSTAKGYVYHMGNVPESWMEDIITANKNYNEQSVQITLTNGFKLPFRLNTVIIKLFSSPRLKKIKLKVVKQIVA